MRGKSFVRTNDPGMHSSGPRPKLQVGSPTVMSSPTLVGLLQPRCAVPAGELPVGRQCTASCCELGSPAGVLPLLKMTARSPLGSVIGSEPWSKTQSCWLRVLSTALPRKQSDVDLPLISSGVDQVLAWSVDMEPKIGDPQ